MALTKTGTDGIKDDAITLDKLAHGTSSQDGKFLRANNGSAPTFETVNTDLVADTSPQLGGDLASNGHDILLADTDLLKVGTGGDMLISHDGTNSTIHNLTGNLRIRTVGQLQITKGSTENMIVGIPDGAVELYHDNSKKLETTSSGGTLYGDWLADANFLLADNDKIKIGNAADLQIYHDGTNTHITNSTGYVLVNSTGGDLALRSNANVYLQPASGENSVVGLANGSTSLYHDGNKRLETSSGGVDISGTTDGVVNINTTDSRGSFIRFQENGTSRCWVGSGEGISLGNKYDLGLRATDAIRMRTGTEEHAVLTDDGFFAAKGMAGNWIYSQAPTSTYCHQFSSSRNGDWMMMFRQEHHNGLGFMLRVNNNNNNEAIALYRENTTNYGFKVYNTGNVQNINNSYGSLSDVSLKENIVDANSQWNDIKGIKVRNFNLKDDTDKVKMLGVVAQELETVSPKLVYEDKDGVKGVHYSVLYMKAIKALQEAIAKIEVLETKVTALEAA